MRTNDTEGSVLPPKDYIDRLVDSTPEGCSVTAMPAGDDVADLCREAEDADFIISVADVPEEVFRAAKNVKFVQHMSSGYGQLPLSVLNDPGVPVAQMKTHSISVAEPALTLMLTALRRIPASMQLMREGKWRHDLDEMSYSELYGQTIGIVGLGNIGPWVGKIVHHGFGANVVSYDNAEIPLTVTELIPARPASLDELMSISDVPCLNIPLNEESDKMIGRDQLAVTKRSGVLVNVGHGEVVDEKALIEYLREGRIAGAGLDVYEQEPLATSSELLNLEQVVCIPHMAGVGWEDVERRIATVWENFDAALHGGIESGVVTVTKRAVIIPAT